MNFQINRKAVIRMFSIYQLPLAVTAIFISKLILHGMPLLISVISNGELFGEYLIPTFLYSVLYMFTLGAMVSVSKVNNMHYSLSDGVLNVRFGVFFKNSFSIPVEKITDISISQGPVGRFFGYSSVNIQTASTGVPSAEVALLGLKEPEQVRDFLLDEIKKRSRVVS